MKNLKKIFLIVGIFGFIAVGILFVADRKSFAQESLISVETPAVPSSETGEQILSLLQQLTMIKLDESIFTDPMFTGLKDYHVDLTEEPKQRSNPFAPIGKDAVIIEEMAGTSIAVPTNIKAATSTPSSV